MQTKLEKALDPHAGERFTIDGIEQFTLDKTICGFSVRNIFGSLEATICEFESDGRVIVLKRVWFGSMMTKRVLFENIEWLGKEIAA